MGGTGADRLVSGLGLSAALLALLALPACRAVRFAAAQFPHADLQALYAAALDNPERNPVVIIPGFAGSKLVRRSDGKTVWGEFFTAGSTSHGNPKGMRALALDLEALPSELDHRHLRSLEDDATAVGPLERVRTDVVVADVSVSVYGQLMKLLGDAGYLDPDREGPPAYHPFHYNAFTFHYDWRQDCVGNALELGRFLEEAREKVHAARRRHGLPEREVRFDVVAHSLGGLVARYYLRYGTEDVLDQPEPEVTWAGAPHVDRLIVVSTPSFGSMKVLRDLFQGRRHPVLPDLHAPLVASMTSIYQMLPRERHPLWIPEGEAPRGFDYMDAELWLENGWGPFAPREEEPLAALFPSLAGADERRRRMASFMDAAFDRARRFAASLDRHPATPAPATLVLFAGDADPTLERAFLRRTGGRLTMVFDDTVRRGLTAPGDGTVTRSSALADERIGYRRSGWLRSPVAWDWTLFISDRHSTLLRNPTFQNNLLHILLERPPERGQRPYTRP